MPYIDSKRRNGYDPLIESLAEKLEQTTRTEPWECKYYEIEGDLNYIIFQLLLQVLGETTRHSQRYVQLNAIMGVLSCVQQEFYRRILVPFEERAIERNGDIHIQTEREE